MTDSALADQINRAERALDRIEAASARLAATNERERKLKATVRGVVAELDSIIASGSR